MNEAGHVPDMNRFGLIKSALKQNQKNGFLLRKFIKNNNLSAL